MSVTERRQQQGSFDLRLKDATPASVRSQLEPFGLVVITPSRYIEGDMTDAMLTGADYAGVLLEPEGMTLRGEGQLWLLGSDNHAGDAIRTPVTFSGVTLSSALATLLPAGQPITVGTVTDTGLNTITATLDRMSRRAAVEQVCALAGAAFRINPNGTIDAALASTLWDVTTPSVVILDDASSWTADVPAGIEASSIVTGKNARHYATEVTAYTMAGDGAAAPAATAAGSAVYTDPKGNALKLVRMVDAPTAPGASASTLATQVLNLATVRTTLAVSARHRDIGAMIEPGDNVYVYKPTQGIVDTANQITHKGVTLTPQIAAVQSITWPCTAGKGYYYRTGSGTYIDLTPYVDTEPVDSVFIEVGAGSSLSGDVTPVGMFGGMSDVASRLSSSPTNSWTPVLTASTTNPTMGTGGSPVNGGFYKIIDGLCWASFSVQFGTTGVAAGTGTYRISGLPVTPKAGRSTFASGRVRLTDASVPTTANFDCLIDDSGLITIRYNATWPTGTDTLVAAGAPWTWAASDRIEGWLIFPVT